jgi:dTDP-4-amino-4,6-dideoxygalactose transaminase
MTDTSQGAKIRLSKSIVGRAEIEALSHVIEHAHLGMGSFVQEFEEKLKNYFKMKHVVCVNSGTAALHLALMGIGLKQDDEVLVQSLTYIATFQAITAAGGKPIPCEIIPETCIINLNDAEKKVTNRTKAIMPVHYASRVGNLDKIYKFAEKYNLRVIEDAAHAFGTIYKGKKIGSLGDIICFSFDGIKNITSGEGGAIATNDNNVAQFVMDARLLGVQKDTEKRYAGLRSWEFDVSHQGYRYHMSNLFAAIGIAQIERFDKEFKPKRQFLAKRYYEKLKDIPHIILFPNDYNEIVPHIFPIRILRNKRDIVRQYLIDNNIECGIHYYPNHLLNYYGAKKGELPVTEQVYGELLTLPLHPGLIEEDQDRVIKCLTECLNRRK